MTIETKGGRAHVEARRFFAFRGMASFQNVERERDASFAAMARCRRGGAPLFHD
jgi:hypothetical protein